MTYRMTTGSIIGIVTASVIGGCVAIGMFAPKTPTKPAADTVDFGRPLFTKEGAIVCPYGVLVSKTVGHDLKSATQAAMNFFGKKEAVEEVGCSMLRDGVSIDAAAKPGPLDLWAITSIGAVWIASIRN